MQYTLTDADVAGPFQPIPKGPAEQAKLTALGYASVDEALGERFHADPALLRQLNPGVDLSKAGSVIQVPNIDGAPPLAKPAKLVVDKSDSTLRLFDADGKVYAQFPVSSGSKHDPLPIRRWKILGVARNPVFKYNPTLFWDAKRASRRPRCLRARTIRSAASGSTCPNRIMVCMARPNPATSARPNRMAACV